MFALHRLGNALVETLPLHILLHFNEQCPCFKDLLLESNTVQMKNHCFVSYKHIRCIICMYRS